MVSTVSPVPLSTILLWRDRYREEMDCQIVHDSLHPREGWTQSYLIDVDGVDVGYGAVVFGGPWKGAPTVFEFYLLPESRTHAFDLFGELLTASKPVAITAQTNDTLLTIMLHTYARSVVTENVVFQDGLTTNLSVDGATFRRDDGADGGWALDMEGVIAATGGVLYHYNRPYGDIYMEVAEPFRRRGLGSYLVQELKRVCYEGGSVPCARCGRENVASRRTLQKAGFVPCANILVGAL